MGLGPRFSSTNSYVANCPTRSLNPNPENFNIVGVWPAGNFFVSLVHYPNCVNYEGRKVLVTRHNPSDYTKLDPHFNEDWETNAGLIARFEPTPEGIVAAKTLFNLGPDFKDFYKRLCK